ncbi:MAG: PAS domain S-box protein [Candidatus Aminicenantes bacterium]|nr:PAS domain S-box protein [Candidatus Aminicenantes bacterium]NIT28115.1 PAS domain S-box protein [Candidatus Aminicenantes bacterium]
MKDENKTKAQLIAELKEMRRLVSEFEKSETLLKQAEETLKEEAIRRRILVEQSRDGIVVLDQNGKVYEANQRYADMLGYSMQEVLQLYVWDWDTQWTREQLMEMVRTVDEAGDHFVTSHRRKDGTLLDVEISTNAAVFGGQKLIFCVCRDITERKRAAEALRESEERYRTLFEASPDGILIADAETMKFRYASPSLCGMLGYCEDELRKMGVEDIHPKDKLEDIIADFEARTRGEKTFTENIPCLKKDGTIIYVDISGTTTVIDGRKCIIGFFRDITARKHLEEQLRDASKMEALGTLVGGIAHEFNNVLAIIMGNAELSLVDVPEWSPVHYNLEEIRAASLRAKDVVRQLLSYVRKIEYKKKPLRLIPVVKDSAKFLRAAIPTNIDIHQTINAEADTVLADPTQINQVLINLCTNAYHAMEESGGNLEIAVHNVVLEEDSVNIDPALVPGNYVKVTVSDTGKGISPQIIDRIFDPFFTTKEVGKGSGMGLSVVHGIIKSYGGAISVESEPGKGTTVNLFFPVVEGEAALEFKPVLEESPTGNERILFIDDEKSMVNMAREILERLGYQVETKMSPVEALELFRSKPDEFDLVITDMAMPKMTGDILAKKILTIRPDIPVILCTGFTEKISEENAYEIGIKAFLTKPLVMREFAVKVRKVLDEG